MAPDSMKLLEILSTSPTGAEQSIMPKSCLVFVYLHLDVFKIVVRCKCTPYNSEFYSAIEEIVYLRLLKSNYAEYICGLLSKSYLASFFEIIRCDYNFETAQKCIEMLENFFVPQEIYC